MYVKNRVCETLNGEYRLFWGLSYVITAGRPSYRNVQNSDIILWYCARKSMWVLSKYTQIENENGLVCWLNDSMNPANLLRKRISLKFQICFVFDMQ